MSEDSSSSASSDSSSSSDGSSTSDSFSSSDGGSVGGPESWDGDSSPATQPSDDVEAPDPSDVPPPPQEPEPGEPLDHVVDDVEAREEAHAWAYMEMKRGRLAEDVHADLVARGWEFDDAEGLVETARKSPGAVEAASRAAPFHRRRGGIFGAIINGIVGIVTAVLGVNDDDESPEALRRADRARRGLCVKCGFDLHGRGGECPNCGTHQPPREVS